MKREILFAIGLFVFIALFFFHPIFKGYAPFPGDLLIGEYAPYNSYPYKEYGPGAYPNKAQNFDVIRLIYPAKLFSIETMKNGQIPLWDPYIFSGNPHLASLQSGTFYPLNILFFALPFSIAWIFFIILQPIFGAVFTYLFLREIRLTKGASILGAITFSFSSFSIVWMEYGNLNHSYVWLPLVLYLIVSILEKPRILKYLVLIFALVSSVFAGYIQFAIYVYGFTFAFLIFYLYANNTSNKTKNIFLFSLLYIASGLISSLQLLPAIELFGNSTRSSYSTSDFLNLLIPSYHFLTFFIPDFFGNPASRNYWPIGTYIERVSYIGIIPAFFAFYALTSKVNKLVWFFGISCIVVVLLVFDTFISRALYSVYIPPILSTAVPSRMMFLFSFSASVLAGFGFSSFEKKYSFRKSILLLLCILSFFAAAWLFVLFRLGDFTSEAFLIAKRNLIIPTAVVFSIGTLIILMQFLKKWRGVILIVFILITVFELFYFFRKITPFAPLDTLYPSTPVMEALRNIQKVDRSWGYGSGYISTNLQVVERIFGTDGYDALHLKRYGEFIVKSENSAKEPPRSEAELLNGYGTDDLKTKVIRKRMMDLLSVKYVLHKSTEGSRPDTLTFPENQYKLVWNDNTWQIYENLNSLPRVQVLSSVIIKPDQENLSTLLNGSIDPRKSVILEEDPGLIMESNSTGSARIIEYTPNKVKIESSSQSEAILTLNDNYYSGWVASIDQNPTKIYRANYTFRAVKVPAGEHIVEFVYKPKSFFYGAIISAFTLGSVVLYFLYLKREK